jgi:hypothetical protein
VSVWCRFSRSWWHSNSISTYNSFGGQIQFLKNLVFHIFYIAKW